MRPDGVLETDDRPVDLVEQGLPRGRHAVGQLGLAIGEQACDVLLLGADDTVDQRAQFLVVCPQQTSQVSGRGQCSLTLCGELFLETLVRRRRDLLVALGLGAHLGHAVRELHAVLLETSTRLGERPFDALAVEVEQFGVGAHPVLEAPGSLVARGGERSRLLGEGLATSLVLVQRGLHPCRDLLEQRSRGCCLAGRSIGDGATGRRHGTADLAGLLVDRGPQVLLDLLGAALHRGAVLRQRSPHLLLGRGEQTTQLFDHLAGRAVDRLGVSRCGLVEGRAGGVEPLLQPCGDLVEGRRGRLGRGLHALVHVPPERRQLLGDLAGGPTEVGLDAVLPEGERRRQPFLSREQRLVQSRREVVQRRSELFVGRSRGRGQVRPHVLHRACQLGRVLAGPCPQAAVEFLQRPGELLVAGGQTSLQLGELGLQRVAVLGHVLAQCAVQVPEGRPEVLDLRGRLLP